MHQKLERQTWILQRIPQPVVIKDQAVEFVQQFKYLGSIIDNKLTFELQVDFVRRKAHQCVCISTTSFVVFMLTALL